MGARIDSSAPRRAVLAVALLAAVAGAGCGGAEEAGGPPGRDYYERIIKQARADLDAHDYDALCGRLARPAREQLGTSGHRTITTCPRDARRFFEPLMKRRQSRSTPRVIAVTVEGRKALARVKLAGNRSAIAPFAIEGGRWKLASVAGVGPAKTPASGLPVAAASGGLPVTVARRAGRPRGPCPELERPPSGAGQLPFAGGCQLVGASPRVELTLVTMFGRFLFARCKSDLNLRVDARGRAWIGSFAFRGGAACADVTPCFDNLRGSMPGEGQLYAIADGGVRDGFYNRVSLCLDTCVGRFVGELKLKLTYDAQFGWRAETVSAISQRSGFGMSGLWLLKPKDLTIRAAPSRSGGQASRAARFAQWRSASATR